jgi:diadenosine tetraphosphate (Ap4A) HIT family hydrolase
MRTRPDCYICSRDAALDRLPPRERVASDALWRVSHAFDAALPGWLLLLPRRHVTSIAELSDMEAVSLGAWQVRLSRALHDVTGCEKTYVAQFAEAEGFAHIHFHVVPRPVGLVRELTGPRVFRLLGGAVRERVSDEEMDEIAIALASRLGS